MQNFNVIFYKLVNNYALTLCSVTIILANAGPIDSPITPAVCSYILPLEKHVIFCQASKINFSKDLLENIPVSKDKSSPILILISILVQLFSLFRNVLCVLLFCWYLLENKQFYPIYLQFKLAPVLGKEQNILPSGHNITACSLKLCQQNSKTLWKHITKAINRSCIMLVVHITLLHFSIFMKLKILFFHHMY